MADIHTKNYAAEEHSIIMSNDPQTAWRQLAQLACSRTAALNKRDDRLKLVLDLEVQLDIPEGGRWHRTHLK